VNAQKLLFHRLMTELLPPAVQRESVSGYLRFDDQTVCPEEARTAMGDLKTLVQSEAHKAFTNPQVGDALRQLSEHNSKLSILERRIVQRLVQGYQRASALPTDFVEKKEKILSDANQAWAEARQKNNSSIFMPHLKAVLKIMKELAEYHGADQADPTSYYSSLLAGYEPGTSPERIDKLVQAVIDWAVPFVRQIAECDVTLDHSPLHGHFDMDRQRSLAEALTRQMGYDYGRGRLALTTHPFMSSINADDHRITMRMNPKFLSSCLFAVMHEGGHALYAQNVDPFMNQINTSGMLYSLGLHESSSRLWENMVGRSLPFLEFAYPIIKALFPQLNTVSLEQFYQAVNVVQPSHIRVEADEVTYMLHIALRYQLEQAIITGEIKPDNIPGEWDKLFEQYFGIKVDKPANGWLQDVHWSYGYYGYFPTYLLGNLASAQLWAAFRKKTPAWESHFRVGDFTHLLGFLKKRLYGQGYVLSLDDAMIEATGDQLDPAHWCDYAAEKFGGLYKL